MASSKGLTTPKSREREKQRHKRETKSAKETAKRITAHLTRTGEYGGIGS